jgi:predicted transcriptional regulator
MVVEGDSSNFKEELQRVLGISPTDISAFKTFLQSVEDMDLSILGIKTFISRTS